MTGTAYKEAPDWVTLFDTLTMVQSSQLLLWILVTTLFGPDHPSTQVLVAFGR